MGHRRNAYNAYTAGLLAGITDGNNKVYFLLLFNRLFSVYKLTRRPRFGRRIFYRPDTLPDTQPTSLKHYKAKIHFKNEIHKWVQARHVRSITWLSLVETEQPQYRLQ